MKITLFEQDYSDTLIEIVEKRPHVACDRAEQFLRDSGHKWLPIRLDYGQDWRQRWSGRIVLNPNRVDYVPDRDALKYMIEWPALFPPLEPVRIGTVTVAGRSPTNPVDSKSCEWHQRQQAIRPALIPGIDVHLGARGPAPARPNWWRRALDRLGL